MGIVITLTVSYCSILFCKLRCEVIMAEARVNKKIGLMVELPECPICLETMSAPIFQCQSGHSICDFCNRTLISRICPICRQPMTQTRNWQLEQLIAKAPMNCPNKTSGCNYRPGGDQLENHVKECIFRVMRCPADVFGGCPWSGVINEMVDHFKNSHHQNVINLNQEFTTSISVTQNGYYVYIVPQGKMIYLLTLLIDLSQKLTYWVVQAMASKKVAQQYIYEINISSLQDNRRKVNYSDQCFSYAEDIGEIFHQTKCCVMPLSLFAQFIDKNILTFNLNVKRNLSALTKEPNTGAQQVNPNLERSKTKYRRYGKTMYRYVNASEGKNSNDE